MSDRTALAEREASQPSAAASGDRAASSVLGGPPSSRRRLRSKAELFNPRPTSVLLDEAAKLTEARRWRRGLQLLTIAVVTEVDEGPRTIALRRLAEAAADGGRHQLSCDAVFELKRGDNDDAATWATFANVALARGNYLHADAAARKAIELDGHNHDAWVAMAAANAGLGWFEAAESCLDRVDRAAMTEQDRWRIGRAVNRWATAKSRWWAVAVPAAILVGILAVAIAVSVPLLVRERRLATLRSNELTGRFEELATSAWRTERWLRASHAVAVVGSILVFVLATLTG